VNSKSSSIQRNISLIILAILVIFSGYLRDTIFKSMNALLRAWDQDQDYYLPSFLSFLQDYEYTTVENLKWLLTVLFSIIYLFFSILIIRLLFNEKKYLKIVVFTYLGILILSGLFIFTGFLFSNTSQTMYEFARYLMGMAQSPIILMILIPTFKLSEKEKPKTSST